MAEGTDLPGQWQDLPDVDDRSFDVAVSYISLVDVPDQAAAVREAFRVLVPASWRSGTPW